MIRKIILLFSLLLLISCAISEEKHKEPLSDASDSDTTDISDVGSIDEELGTKSLQSLEEDLEYIENI